LQFVRNDSQIRIIPPHAKVDDYIRLIRELPEEDRFLGEIMVAGGCLTQHELEDALKRFHPILQPAFRSQRWPN
jgi:two-component system chemotaxis sensor kinase CheA